MHFSFIERNIVATINEENSLPLKVRGTLTYYNMSLSMCIDDELLSSQ